MIPNRTRWLAGTRGACHTGPGFGKIGLPTSDAPATAAPTPRNSRRENWSLLMSPPAVGELSRRNDAHGPVTPPGARLRRGVQFAGGSTPQRPIELRAPLGRVGARLRAGD